MQMQGIASQILNETPSTDQAQVTPQESSENQTPAQSGGNDFDQRFNVLAKMERKLKEQEGQFKSRSKEWEEKERRLTELEEFERLMDENPLEALKRKKGWGIQEFNEFAVKHSDDEDLDPVAKITRDYEDKMAKLREELTQTMDERIKSKEEEIHKGNQERQIIEFKAGIKGFLSENKDEYEFIMTEDGGHEAVFDLIYQDIQKQQQDGTPDNELRIMDIKEAADKIEAFLDKSYSKYLSLNKVKSRFGANDNPFAQITKSAEEQFNTLNSSFSTKSKTASELSKEERERAAIELVKSMRS